MANEWIAIGEIVNHEDLWDLVDGEIISDKLTVIEIEEYDEDDPHENVTVTDKDGDIRYFDETELEIS